MANPPKGGRPSAPTNEIGAPTPYYAIPGGALGLGDASAMPWATYVDDREQAPDLRWAPGNSGSTKIYGQMQDGDAQIAGLLMATTMPIRRMLWEIDPGGTSDRIAQHVAQSHGVPVRGQEDTADVDAGIDHDRHLAHALRALAFGHFYFEVVYRYSDPAEGGDGLMHLAKLGTRPPRTILNFVIAPNGELLGIIQNVGMQMATASTPFGTGVSGKAIDANRLLPYVWNSQDDGDWIGRSMLRPTYRNWLLKDRLIRVDATKHERNGMGIPWYKTDPNATKPQIDALAAMAQEIRSGTRGGGAGPGELHIQGVEGSVPDTVASIRYHDEQMSKGFLSLYFDLAGANRGNRALGETFADFHVGIQNTIADWYAAATQVQIDDEVLINFGPDAVAPKLVWTRVETLDASLEDLGLAVEKGLIVVTDPLRQQIAERWKLTGQDAETVAEQKAKEPKPPVPPAPGDPAQQPHDGADGAPAPASEPPKASQPSRSALEDEIVTKLTGPMAWPELAEAIGRDRRDGTARRAREALLAEGAILKRASDGRLAPMAGLRLPDRELRRNPMPFEVEAAVDFAQMEATFVSDRSALVAAVKAAQPAQIAEIEAAVEAAAGDAEALAKLTVEPVDVGLIEEHLQTTAEAGVAAARGEHEAQQATAPPTAAAAATITVAQDKLEGAVHERAQAVAMTLAGGLGTAASKRASAVATLPPATAAQNVGDYLRGLSDAALEEQLGGATQQAYNTGRRAYMTEAKPKTVYASEILDANTCDPCAAEDGSEWNSIAEAEADYPLGGYVECEGGLRCRGTLVAVY